MSNFKKYQTTESGKNLKSAQIYPNLHEKTFFKGIASLGVMNKGSLGKNEGDREFKDLVSSMDLTKF